MSLRRRLLKESRLYIIADKKVCGRRPISKIVSKARDSGAGIIQLRDKESKKAPVLKEAYKLHKLLAGSNTLFIINDSIDIAKIVDSDGVHLGQYDLPPKTARQLLGNDKIIGISCHSLSQAVRAQKNGADYISIGPIFPTPTKPEYKPVGLDLIKKARKAIRIPFFVIGGINENNINEVLSLGVNRVAVCRAVCRAKDVKLAVKKLTGILRSNDTVRIR